jgi:hypothetical protein
MSWGQIAVGKARRKSANREDLFASSLREGSISSFVAAESFTDRRKILTLASLPQRLMSLECDCFERLRDWVEIDARYALFGLALLPTIT